MAGEAEPRLHGAAEREADLLRGGETERGLASSPCRHEGEPRVSLSRSLSFASASDVSFLSGVTSSSSSSLRSDVESDDGDAMYPWTQSEYEEIPSFRWIATPLRWWKTSRRTHPRKRSSAAGAASGGEEPGLTGLTEVGSDRETSTKLVHFDGHHAFTLRELMRADAEVLGRGNYGTVYRATLEDGKQVAVRRLTGVETAKDFVAEVNVLGKIRHPNVLALRAYYYSPEEKFLVFDYMPRGSLSAFLHARCPHTPIDWPTRMSIAIGSTRGLHYLHTQGNMVHGNLTSGNVLLDYHVNAKIANYGLSKLLTTAVNSNEMETAWASGYHAPELSSPEKANRKTDVYSLGVIMLELLTGKSPRGLDLRQWIASFTEEMTTRREFRDTLNLALNCADPSPNARPDLQQVLQQLEEINSNLARATCAFATNGGNKPTDEGAGAAGITAIVAPATEERTATPFEDAEEGTPDTSSVLPTDENLLRSRATENIVSSPLASPASGAEVMPTPINSCKDKDEELAESTSQGDPEECDAIPSPTPAEEITRDPSGNEELQAPSLGDCFINLSTVQPEVKDGASFPSFNMDKAMAEDRTGERMGTEGIDAMSGGTVASPLSSIDWAKVTIEVPLEVPTSPSLISSDPDSGYQRYFQTLYDLAHRSPPLPSNVLEVQLNKMIMGLHSLGYPLDTWLKAATLVLLFAKKREYIEQHVDDHKVHVEAQLKEFASAIAPVEEGISRTQSDISTLERKQEELDETIAKLEDQLAALKTQREEVLDSLTMARDQLVAAEAKMESVAVDMDRLNQHYSAIRDLQSAMLRELPSLDEAFDSSFREIMARKF